MDSTVIAAIIGAVAVVTATLIPILLKARKKATRIEPPDIIKGEETMGKSVTDLAHEAIETIDRILVEQQTGSTPAKWKRERYEQLISNLAGLSATALTRRIQDNLRDIVNRDDDWERRNPPSTGTSLSGTGIPTAIVTGVMEDNRKIHVLTKELFHQISSLISAGASDREVLDLLKRALWS